MSNNRWRYQLFDKNHVQRRFLLHESTKHLPFHSSWPEENFWRLENSDCVGLDMSQRCQIHRCLSAYLFKWTPTRSKRSRGCLMKNWMNCILEDASVFSGERIPVLGWLEELVEHSKLWRERWFDTTRSSSVQATQMIEETLSRTSK